MPLRKRYSINTVLIPLFTLIVKVPIFFFKLFNFITVKTVETKQEFNLNWLLYTLYARQDFPACKNLIEQQLKENYDHEFLYFIKVYKKI